MPFVIGTDEAGYGPNLGPLVVTGTLWKVPTLEHSLFDLLGDVVSKSAAKKNSDQISICDSKKLFQSGSMEPLERNVLGILGFHEKSWRGLMKFLQCSQTRKQQEGWLAGAKLKLPTKAIATSVEQLHQKFRKGCQSAKVELVAVKSKTVFPNDFNRGIDELGNKATLLTGTTLSIVRELVDSVFSNDSGDFAIYCDRHGGRAKYAGPIQHHLTDQLVQIVHESPQTSQYRWQENDCQLNIQFSVGGESAMSVGLASMVSKYVREIYMQLWNDFWQQHLPHLKPTKGYPQDAKRFMLAIEPLIASLNLTRESVWRNR